MKEMETAVLNMECKDDVFCYQKNKVKQFFFLYFNNIY